MRIPWSCVFYQNREIPYEQAPGFSTIRRSHLAGRVSRGPAQNLCLRKGDDYSRGDGNLSHQSFESPSSAEYLTKSLAVAMGVKPSGLPITLHVMLEVSSGV